MKARLPEGYGGAGNMQNMLKQVQKMQEDMNAYQDSLDERMFDITAGGGTIKITMSGKKELKEITLSPEIVDPDDIEMLQDLIVAAVNEAIDTVEKTTEAEMAEITGPMSGMMGGMGGLGGMKLPGMR